MPQRVFGLDNLPEFMQQGSNGELVNLLILVFMGWSSGDQGEPAGLKPDRDYGGVLAGVVKRFQNIYGLDQDGHFGPDTRKEFARIFGITFAELAALCSGSTIFVQPNGSEIIWSMDRRKSAPPSSFGSGAV